MNWIKAKRILEAIEEAPEHTALSTPRKELVRAAIKYARIRTDWLVASLEDRMTMDSRRTAAHNAFIDTCNAMSRAMHTAGFSNEWRAELTMDRKEIGDFACYLHCVFGVRAR